MREGSDFDVVVIGAGHDGLAATALLAGRGLRVLCLEKNASDRLSGRLIHRTGHDTQAA